MPNSLSKSILDPNDRLTVNLEHSQQITLEYQFALQIFRTLRLIIDSYRSGTGSDWLKQVGRTATR
jgi:hypothetical protein